MTEQFLTMDSLRQTGQSGSRRGGGSSTRDYGRGGRRIGGRLAHCDLQHRLRRVCKSSAMFLDISSLGCRRNCRRNGLHSPPVSADISVKNREWWLHESRYETQLRDTWITVPGLRRADQSGADTAITDTIRSSVKYPLRCERSQSHQLDDYGTEMMLPSGESQRNVSGRQPKALFTLANSATNCRQIFRRIRRQSPKTATVAEFGDGRRFGRQSPNSTSPFSVTVATIVASVDRA